MVFTPYPNNSVNEILPYGDTTHVVSVVWIMQYCITILINAL